MPLLDKQSYLTILAAGKPAPGEPSADQCDRVLRYATRVWPTLELAVRRLTAADVSVVYQIGRQSLFHVRAFPRKRPDTFVIVVTDDRDRPTDHILIDLSAEYATPTLDCPQFDFNAAVRKKDIHSLIPRIEPGEDNPFAILSLEDGTFLQTYRNEDGFQLEYQLVNMSSHYEIPEPASADEVVAAMISYAFGKNEWLQMFDWRKQRRG